MKEVKGGIRCTGGDVRKVEFEYGAALAIKYDGETIVG